MHSLELADMEDIIKNAPPILDKSLFDSKNLIKLPAQLDLFTEANLKFTLWYALEKEFTTQGEVKLGNEIGIIDLVCEIPFEKPVYKVGIECKTSLDSKNLSQIDVYENSGKLNTIYLASFAVGNYEEWLYLFLPGGKDYESGASLKQLEHRLEFSKNSYEKFGQTGTVRLSDGRVISKIAYDKMIDALAKKEECRAKNEEHLKQVRKTFDCAELMIPCGFILYNPLGEVCIKSNEILYQKRLPYSLPRNESSIQYACWKYLKNNDYLVSAESKLHSATRIETKQMKKRDKFGVPRHHYQDFITGTNRPDIIALPEQSLNSEDAMKPNILGIECKYDNINIKDLADKLKSYLNSGDLSCLYVAIPAEKPAELETVESLVSQNDFQRVGILTVDMHGELTRIKEAEKIEIKGPPMKKFEKRTHNEGIFKSRIYELSA